MKKTKNAFPPKRSFPFWLALFPCYLGLVLSNAKGADRYILPEGTGLKNGTGWDNAQAGGTESFQAAWSALSPGDTLHVGSGTYEAIVITASKGGTAGKPVRMLGVDRGGGLPLFKNNFDKSNPAKTGGLFFNVAKGVSYWEIEGLRLQAYQTGIRLNGGAHDINISRVNMTGMREGIRSEGRPEQPEVLEQWTRNVTVADCQFIHFTKRAIRLEGGNQNWRIERCHADAGGKEWSTEPFAICYQIGGVDRTVKDQTAATSTGTHEHHIEFFDCSAVNAYYDKGTGYWNADGFCAEDGTHHLRYVRCFSADHTDGGWDDKSLAPELVDCVSVRNKKNYRFWKTGVKLKNCISAFAYKLGGNSSPSGLWTGGQVEAEFCTFFENEGLPVEVERDRLDAGVTLRDCIVVLPEGQSQPTQDPRWKLVNSTVWAKPESEGDPQISVARDSVQSSKNQIFDSVKYGQSKGFHSARVSK